jgi:hypothetical protein
MDHLPGADHDGDLARGDVTHVRDQAFDRFGTGYRRHLGLGPAGQNRQPARQGATGHTYTDGRMSEKATSCEFGHFSSSSTAHENSPSAGRASGRAAMIAPLAVQRSGKFAPFSEAFLTHRSLRRPFYGEGAEFG